MWSRRAVPVIALLGAACQVQVQEQEAPDPATDIEAINAVRHAEAAAVVTGDTLLAYATDDFVQLPPDAPMVAGIAAARARAALVRSQVTIHLITYDEPTIEVAGDLAVERYTGVLLLTPAGGAPTTEFMKGTHVYRRTADGTWKLALDVWNMDGAPGGD